MGIPHLRETLRPYTVSKSLKGKGLVVDGPALAYFVYYELLKHEDEGRQYRGAILTYSIIQDTVISWLNRLSRQGATM